MRPLKCRLGFHKWIYSPIRAERYCLRLGCDAKQVYFGQWVKLFIAILVLAGALWAGDSITAVSPITQINVLKIQVQGYDTNKVYLGSCIDKYGMSTVCVAQDMLPYFQKDTTIKFNPQGVNLRFTMKDYGKDSTIVNAYNQLMRKLTLGRVTLK